MELRHLRYVLAVGEERSFTRAAERLHVAQPSLSVQVKALEAELGVELFDRSRRTIQVTAAGEAMMDEARSILRHVERSTAHVKQTGAGYAGRLALGFVPSASNAVLPPLVRAFTAAHPDVTLDLLEMAPRELFAGIHAARLDICCLYLPFEDDALQSVVISEEEFIVALPSGHVLADAPEVDVRALREQPFVLPANHGMPGLHAQVLAICRDAGFYPRAVQEDVWLVQTIVGLVGAGAGVALVPANARALTPDGVVYRSLAGPVTHRVQMAAVWRRGDGSPLLSQFVNLLAGR